VGGKLLNDAPEWTPAPGHYDVKTDFVKFEA
jgi:hypothetical protein